MFRKSSYLSFPHSKTLRKDSKIQGVMARYGAKGYGVLICLFETLLESPMFESEFRFEEFELRNLGLTPGERSFCHEVLFFMEKQTLIEIHSFDDVYFILRSSFLVEIMSKQIGVDKRRAIRKQEEDLEVKKILNKHQRKKVVVAKEIAKTNMSVKRMQSYLEFSERKMEEAHRLFVGFDVDAYLRFFRDEYVVSLQNVELYLNTITQESAFAMFITFMHENVLTQVDRDKIASNAKKEQAIAELKQFNL